MANNPLQQYFRQPKVFIQLPSHGVYNKEGTLQGDVENMPVFGMTGMDEILLKTPDALITGETTVKVVQSCCPAIKDGWDVNNLDIDALLVAIRIATYGNTMTVTHVCDQCNTDAEYEIELSKILEHFGNCRYDSKLVVGELTVKLRPLNYKDMTTFNLENFGLQKRLQQVITIENEEERQKSLSEIFTDLGQLQNKIFIAGVEQVEMPNAIVDDPAFIKEWLENADKSIFDSLKTHISKNNDAWRVPLNVVKCENCGAESSFGIELDQASFFANA